ncbi:MAG TPA: GNAT family protein [Microbacterium sp.]|uniref:GNAT family N-acetyltransferase n=1 Tax=Microbacterium sp. TaxID=51671 RepID=UPI002BEB4E6D|nr:GNAT family protein [Microbacterium sp.]HWI31528.1 GNAT family protein [Microbacterium sp.]
MLLIEPVTLEGAHVHLEPLSAAHIEGLRVAAGEPGLEALWFTSVPTPDGVAGEIESRLAQWEAGTMNPWAIRRLPDHRVVGMTSFCGIDQPNRRVEIGHTWLAPSAQRSAVNTEAKLLLLGHAFEACDAIAVEFRTHWHNHRSRAAIARLGAKQDGVLRSHRISPDGSLRDTVVFSIIAPEWPAVRMGLRARLQTG